MRIAAVAMLFGTLLTAQSSVTFEVASIRRVEGKPNQANETSQTRGIANTADVVTIRNSNLRDCLQWAYGVRSYQVDGPDWINTGKYDIQARASQPSSTEDLRHMLRNLLGERFGIVVERRQQQTAVYALGGRPSLPVSAKPESSARRDGPGLRMRFERTSLAELAEFLSELVFVDRPVVDATGSGDAYDFVLDLTDASAFARSNGSTGVSVFTAIREQLGLALEPQSASIEVLAVQGGSPEPTEN